MPPRRASCRREPSPRPAPAAGPAARVNMPHAEYQARITFAGTPGAGAPGSPGRGPAGPPGSRVALDLRGRARGDGRHRRGSRARRTGARREPAFCECIRLPARGAARAGPRQRARPPEDAATGLRLFIALAVGEIDSVVTENRFIDASGRTVWRADARTRRAGKGAPCGARMLMQVEASPAPARRRTPCMTVRSGSAGLRRWRRRSSSVGATSRTSATST